MADSDFKTQVSRTEAANSASNVIFTQIADNAGNVVTVTGGRLDVNATVSIETALVDDSAFAIGTDKVNAQGFLADETATDSVDEGDIGIARMTLDRRMIVAADQRGTWTVDLGATDNAVLDAIAASLVDIETNTDYGAVVGGGVEATALRVTIANDSTGVLSIDDNGGSITVDGSVTVSATDLDIRDLTHVSDSVSIGDGTTIAEVLSATNNALYTAVTDGTEVMAVNVDGSINVAFSPVSSTTEVHDYDHAVATGTGASTNHDYTVTGTTFLCSGVLVASSGKGKYEIQFGPIAGLATIAVGFLDADESKFIPFIPALPVPVTGTGTLRVIKTNRQGTSTDFYSTIMGEDV